MAVLITLDSLFFAGVGESMLCLISSPMHDSIPSWSDVDDVLMGPIPKG
jgi:hypothetical protein